MMTNPIDAVESLIAELSAYCKAQNLPMMCALELQSENITSAQRAWLQDYCQRWDNAVEAEFTGRAK